MKLHTTRIIGSICILVLLQSCLKDQGNYDYDYGNKVTVIIPALGLTGRLGDTVTINPQLIFSDPNDTLEFDHEWYAFGELYSTERVLKYVPTILGNNQISYHIIDRRTGISYTTEGAGRTIVVTSPFTSGWTLLYERNGASELGHVALYNGEYVNYYDLYQDYNDGEQMGSQPIRLQDYQVPGTGNLRGMYILQHGGQGSIELNSSSLRKQLVAAESFAGGVPTDFAPVDFGFYHLSRTNLLVNHDGRVFSRAYASNAIAYTYSWTSTPMYISSGMEITDIWDSWGVFSRFALAYDKLNKRVLLVQSGVALTSVGGIAIDTLPQPSQPYPDEYTPPNNLGDWEYRWGGTFGDALNNMVGAMIIKNPQDQQFYYQSFQARVQPNTITPRGTRRLFSGSSLIREDSKFEAIKPREYIFFTSENALYYYDAVTGETKQFTTFGSRITAIRANDFGTVANLNTSLAVGLEDGTFILYDISDPALIAGQVNELHRATGFGKIVDLLDKGGRNTN